ncbi:FliM/FliN family flagellar motor switch protein [Solirhodobacter olei]|uniref:FliM/FliN family flagellar motor switch protein n=1 Tax=Solirhodobacter olei TaxID=2493082 RepID=UPI0013E2D8CE|nr:FliM/FliN family flagellar motor switch protein [Solirhodobacter olei]
MTDRVVPVEEQIIQMSMLNYEPLPMLEVIAERFVLSLTSSLKTQTASVVDVKLSRFDYMSYAAAMAELPGQGLIAVCNAEPWDNSLLMAMDSRFLFAALELMLGGQLNKSTGKAATKPGGHTFTTIERRMGQKLAELTLAELREGMQQVSDVNFVVERMESNPHFATIAQPNSAAVLMSLDVDFEGTKGSVAIIIPYGTLDPIRPLLTKVFYGERYGDDAWRKHLSERIETSTVTLTALLHERSYPMAEVLCWAVGDTIDLRLEEDHPATVLCSGVPMFKGVLGKKQNGSSALRVTEDLNGRDELSHVVDPD